LQDAVTHHRNTDAQCTADATRILSIKNQHYTNQPSCDFVACMTKS